MPKNQSRIFRLLTEILDTHGILFQNQILTTPQNFINQLMSNTELADKFESLLNAFNSTRDFTNQNGPRIDGLLSNHLLLGTRIIEFDEEQHFTPHRMQSIQLFKEHLPFSTEYEVLFAREDVRIQSISKNRLRNALDVMHFIDLVESDARIRNYVEINHINNNYVRPTNGFNYPGGRLAQRAVYDLMKDLYHMIKSDFEPIIRFSIFEFELEYGVRFNICSDEQIKALIRKKLELLGLK